MTQIFIFTPAISYNCFRYRHWLRFSLSFFIEFIIRYFLLESFTRFVSKINGYVITINTYFYRIVKEFIFRTKRCNAYKWFSFIFMKYYFKLKEINYN